MRAIPPTPGSVTSRPDEKAEALRRRAALPARAPLGARAAIGAAPALDLDFERFASPVAHHAAAEIASAVPGAPSRLLLRSRFGRHVVVSLGEALHTRGHSRASDLSGYAVVSSGDARVQSLPPECRTRPPVAGAATSGAATRHDGFRDSDRSDGLGHSVADQGGRNTARLLRPPPELPVRRPPSYRRLTLPLLALASMIPGTAAAQGARPARPARPAQPARPVRQYTIEQFMNTTAMFGASFSPDERSILVTSDQSGVFNAYEIRAGDGKPQARTRSTTDGIFTVGYLPHDRRVLYLQGPGGNENDHLYLLDTTGTARDLTPGDSLKAVFVDWAGDDSSFYYATNGRDRRFFDVFEMPVATLAPRRVFQDTVGYQVGAISADRRWMALQRTITTQNSEMYLRDMHTGEMRHLSPHEGDVQYNPQAFSSDGKYLYYTTDEGSEFAWLARYDLATGRRDTVERPSWDVDFAYFSKHGKYLVAGINADARTEIRVYEAATHRPVALPRVPMGEIRGVQISPSERSMALYVNGSRAPSNLYVLDLGTGKLRRLTQNLSADVDPANLVEAQVVRFPSYDGVAVPSLLYRPLQVAAADRAPGPPWIHSTAGGQSRVGYSAFLQYLANHGYVVLAVNNRGSGGYDKSFDKLDDQRQREAD